MSAHVFAAACATGLQASCVICPARSACVGQADTSSGHERDAWSNAVLNRRPWLARGTALFEAGQPATAIYSVRDGCIKSFTVDQDGNERVRGFFLPGDLLGLDALAAPHYLASATAVTPSEVCTVPREQLHRLFSSSPELMRHVLERTSRELATALALSGDYTAEERLAAFLLHMQARQADVQHRVWHTVLLPMTRRDIGNYLRLVTETVCRVLTRFADHGLIEVNQRAIRLVAPRKLEQLAQPVGLHHDAMPLNQAA